MKQSTPPIGAQTTHNQRNSSIELYRIIATFTVLIVHFNGWFVGGMPEILDLEDLSTFRLGQAIIESATCICVNMFLIISGYFGIHLKLSSVFRIVLLLLFIKVPLYLFNSLYHHTFGIGDFIHNFFVISKAGYFVQCYMMLMFLSPALNALIEKRKKHIVLYWTIAFFLIEFYFDNIKNIECFGFNKGYSIMHFVLMYMVARCLSIYKETLMKIRLIYWIVGYFACTLMIMGLYTFGVKWTFAYSNPVVIMSAICTFMPFIYRFFYNKFINWIAAGTFTVYIVHCANPVYSYLVRLDNFLLESYPYCVYLVFIMLVICFLFILCIIYDKLCNIAIVPVTKFVHIKYDGKYDLR